MRNKQFDFMLAVGIIFVIMGHNYQPPFLFFPAYSFHMGLFFFISGYFFKPQITIKDKAFYIYKKIKSQLIPYFILNLVFGVITSFLKSKGVNLGGEINYQRMFVIPFLRGDQFQLYLAAWFLLQLFIVCVIAGLVYTKSKKINIGVVAVSFVGMLVLLQSASVHTYTDWKMVAVRTSFGFCFFSLGYLFKVFEPVIKEYIIKPITLVILFLVVNILNANFGDITYTILLGNVGNKRIIVPVITTISIILIVYAIGHYISKILKSNSFVYKIGQCTFSIMVWHFTAFLLVNLALYLAGYVKYSDLSNVYLKFNAEKLWLVYFIAAVLMPMMLAYLYRNVKKRILKLIPLYTH